MKKFICIAILLAGCSSNQTVRTRQDSALKDPMNYSPNTSEHNVSSGGITDLDAKGLKRDFNSVFNP
jgi:hypothetical protein